MEEKVGNKIKFTRSLRFKLTIIYSLILFIFASLFVLSINLYLDNYLSKEPPKEVRHFGWIIRQGIPVVEYNEEQIEMIQDVRKRDLEEIQDFSVLALFPLFLLSFGVGYFVSGRFLFPLKLLQKEVDNLKEKNLGSKVKIHDDDEIGMLANSFNEMSIRLKSSFDAQTQFVQDASHELRTPLTIIHTNLDTAYSDENQNKNELRDSIKNALDGTKRLAKLTSTLLDLTVPSELTFEDVNISKVVHEQLELLENFAKENNVKLIENCPNKNIEIKADRSLFSRALFNLIENAIKYSKDAIEPQVTIQTEQVKDKVHIEIIDNGVGIPEEMQKRIFERFYRIDKSRSRMSGGFGLGLSIVKQIVDEHNWDIDVISKEGFTKFTIII